jgi:hypothetical protein
LYFLYNKNFVFLLIWMQVWSLEKKDTPHSFSSRVFFIIISFIFSHFLLFIWFFFIIFFLLNLFYCISLSLQQWIKCSCNSWALRVNLNSSRKNSRRLSSDQDPLLMISSIKRNFPFLVGRKLQCQTQLTDGVQPATSSRRMDRGTTGTDDETGGFRGRFISHLDALQTCIQINKNTKVKKNTLFLLIIIIIIITENT